MFDDKQNSLLFKIKIFFENYYIEKRVCKNTLFLKRITVRLYS